MRRREGGRERERSRQGVVVEEKSHSEHQLIDWLVASEAIVDYRRAHHRHIRFVGRRCQPCECLVSSSELFGSAFERTISCRCMLTRTLGDCGAVWWFHDGLANFFLQAWTAWGGKFPCQNVGGCLGVCFRSYGDIHRLEISDSRSNRLHVDILQFSLYSFAVYSIDSSKMIGNSPWVLRVQFARKSRDIWGLWQ